MALSAFGAPLVECKLQTTNVVDRCVMLCLFISLTHCACAVQVSSLSYHSASGNIVVGFSNGHVEMWKTAPYIAPPAAPRSAPQVAVAAPIPVPKPQAAPQVRLSVHECVRERLSKAQAQVNDIQGSIGKANKGLRQQMTREYELKRSIADLEVKCAYIIMTYFSILIILVSGERKEGTSTTSNSRVYCRVTWVNQADGAP